MGQPVRVSPNLWGQIEEARGKGLDLSLAPAYMEPVLNWCGFYSDTHQELFNAVRELTIIRGLIYGFVVKDVDTEQKEDVE